MNCNPTMVCRNTNHNSNHNANVEKKLAFVRGEGNRIPKALQAVFVFSNRSETNKVRCNKTVSPMTQRNNSTKNTSNTRNAFSSVFRISSSESSDQHHYKYKTTTDPIKKDSGCKDETKKKTKKERTRLDSVVLASCCARSPTETLESLLESRGYSVVYYDALDCGYHTKPTPLQKASYGTSIIDAVRQNKVEVLESLLDAGLHPDACNPLSGESLVHLACRSGTYQTLQVLLDFGCTVRIADSLGRTPMHEICWSRNPSFYAVAMMLEIEPSLLFVKDCRGATPLSYVQKDQWEKWNKFLDQREDEYWPKQWNSTKNSEKLCTKQPSPRCSFIRDPKNALPVILASLVSSGKMTPYEAEMIRNDTKILNNPFEYHQADDTTSQDMTSSSFNITDDDDDDVDEEDEEEQDEDCYNDDNIA